MKIHKTSASPTDLKLALQRMAPTSEQADSLSLLLRAVDLLEQSGLFKMEVEFDQPDDKGSGIMNWSASFKQVGTPGGG